MVYTRVKSSLQFGKTDHLGECLKVYYTSFQLPAWNALDEGPSRRLRSPIQYTKLHTRSESTNH